MVVDGWVGYIWYSDEGIGALRPRPVDPLLVVPNVTVHPPAAIHIIRLIASAL